MPKQAPYKDLGLKLGPDLEVNVDRTRQIEAATPYIMRLCKHRRLPTAMQMILEKPYLSAIAIYGLEHARLAKGQVQRTRKRLYQTAKALTGLGARTVATGPFLRDLGLVDPVVDGPRRTTTLLVSSYGQNTISGELARTSVPISFPRKETWMEDAASRIAEWIEWGGGLGQYEWVLWSATNKLEWEYPADIKILTIPMRRSSGGSPSEPPTLVPKLEKALDNFRLLGGPKAIWARAAAAALTNQDKKLFPGARPV